MGAEKIFRNEKNRNWVFISWFKSTGRVLFSKFHVENGRMSLQGIIREQT